MKNLLAILFLFTLVSCGGKNKKTESATSEITSTKESTKEESTTADGDKWESKELLDEFGEASGVKCAYLSTYGTFSNSATSGSHLFVELLFTKNKAGILLHEYNDDKPAAKFIGGGGKMKMKKSDGTDISISITGDWDKQGGLSISGSDYNKLKEFITKNDGEIKVVITDKYSSSYNFKINSNSFESELAKL
jgi:hypothetical protein